MTPHEAAAAVQPHISQFGTRFMMDPAFYASAAAKGFEGLDFYVVGRGGVLGDVDADVVTAAFGFFEPHAVRSMWERGRQVMGPHDAAALFATSCVEWCAAHLTAPLDHRELADLAERIIAAAPVPGLPLFAGWRAVERPDDDRGAAALALHILRELRGGLHVIGELAAGLTPLETLLVKGGEPTAQLFGWRAPYPDVADRAAVWDAGERITNDLTAAAHAALEPHELDRFVELVTALRTGMS